MNKSIKHLKQRLEQIQLKIKLHTDSSTANLIILITTVTIIANSILISLLNNNNFLPYNPNTNEIYFANIFITIFLLALSWGGILELIVIFLNYLYLIIRLHPFFKFNRTLQLWITFIIIIFIALSIKSLKNIIRF